MPKLPHHIIKILKFEFVGGGVDRHSSWKLPFLRWGGRGGEGGSINTHLGSCHFLGGEGGGEEGREGRGVNQHSSWKLHFLGGGGGGEGRGGQLTLTLKVKLGLPCRSGWIDTDPGGGGSIDTHFESEVGINLRIQGGLTLILGGSIDTHFESEVGINLWIWGGSTLILGGS